MVAYDIRARPIELEWADTWANRKTAFVTHPGVLPATIDAWPGRRIYFKSMDTSNFFFTNVLPVAYGDVIPSYMFLFSCSVAAQMSLAHAMGYSPLIFVGCDFADARFRKWVFNHAEKKWVQDPDVYDTPRNYLTSANGQVTNSLQVFYKRSTLCVWRIDGSQCLITSPKSIITEMPYVSIEDVIANQGEGFEDKYLTREQIYDTTEKYLAHFNSFIMRFKPDANGRVSYRVLESHKGTEWEADVRRYLTAMRADMQAQRLPMDIDVDANIARFKWLKDENAKQDIPLVDPDLSGVTTGGFSHQSGTNRQDEEQAAWQEKQRNESESDSN